MGTRGSVAESSFICSADASTLGQAASGGGVGSAPGLPEAPSQPGRASLAESSSRLCQQWAHERLASAAAGSHCEQITARGAGAGGAAAAWPHRGDLLCAGDRAAASPVPQLTSQRWPPLWAVG